jgi:FtsZ-interacting cell division protein ZipA
MSDLQFGLLAIGAVVVIAVLAFNKWQEVRFRREAEGSLKSRHDDVLMGAAKEPAAAPGAPAAPAERPQSAHRGEHGGERIEPTFDSSETGTVPAVRAASEEPLLTEPIDFIVTVEAAEDIDGEALVEAAAAPLAGFSKPVRLEGFNAAEAKWEPLRPDVRYTLMRAALQLVDRRGPVSDGDLATFGAGVQQAAAAAGALATVPDHGEAMAHATELDKFCGQVDILIAIHVVAAGTPFAGTKVRALAEANGLVLEEDGRFRRRDDEGRVLYELANMDATPFRAEAMRSMSVSGLTLELDVPRAPEPARAFEQFRDLARQLAQALEASVVDEKRSPVSPAAFDQIASQIQAVQRAMAARSIPPGTPSALRLFS